MRPILLCAIGALTLACGGTRIHLSADRQQITAGGADYAVITAVLANGDEALTRQTLQFETTDGSFSEDGQDLEAKVATGPGGKAQVKLYSSRIAGTATVTVLFENPVADVTAVASISIRSGKPTGDWIPRANSVQLHCQAANIGALREPLPDISVSCTLSAQTVRGQELTVSALDPLLFAEAGSLKKEIDESGEDLVLVYTPKGGEAAPIGVAPDKQIAEPWYPGAGDKVHNPRDGLVTLVAVVEAQEDFTDENGNGVYDEGEPFIDTPEPFVDVDDDGRRDSGERFVDTDGDGVWDRGNQVWDKQAQVMAIYKILWTGAVYNGANASSKVRSGVFRGPIEGAMIVVRALAVDRNLNPIAGFADNLDQLIWNVEGTGVDAVTPSELPIHNTRGFSFDKTAPTELARWRPVAGSFKAESYDLTLRADTTADPQSVGFVVSAQLSFSPGPRGIDDFVEQITERIEHTLAYP